MKNLFQKQQESASVLLVALLFAVIVGVVLSSYLVLIGNREQAVVRSQGWNSALNMAEAGVEEALAQMNASPNDFAANGWGQSGGAYGPVSRSLLNGSYKVSIVPGSIPTIYSTGSVTVPIAGASVSRVVKVTTLQFPLINVAFGAISNIDMHGNGLASDSWNSHDPKLSTNGHYDPSKTSTNGNVASEYGLVDLGNHTVGGNLYLGPTASYNGSSNNVLNQIYYDYNVQFPDVVLPTTSWYAAPTTGSGKSSFHDFTSSGDYVVNDSKDIIVEAGVTVRLHVTIPNFNINNLAIHGGTTNSGTLMIYQDSGSIGIAGNTAVDASNRPENLWYYGLPGVTSVTYSGNSSFVGVIYAPEANLTLNGGGNNVGLIGASITRTITMNGHYDFHYDESLMTNGPPRGYVVASWQER